MKDIWLLILVFIAAAGDLKCGKISNHIITVGIVSGFYFRIIEEGLFGIIFILWNVSVPIILFFLLFLVHALGAGDIKLFSMVGSLMSFHQLCVIIQISFLFGGIWALFYLIIGRRKKRIVMGVPIAMGCLMAVYGNI